MGNAIHVSPVSGDNTVLLNGFRIAIVAVGSIVHYSVYRKGLHIRDYNSLQEAVDWCKID